MPRANDGIWPIVGALMLGCIPTPTEVVPHADGSTGPAEGITASSEPPLTESTTAQAEATGSATGADTSDAGTTQGAQLDTSSGGASTSGEPGTGTGEAATSTSGDPGTSTGAPPSCDELFGTAPGYIYCTETDMACHFNATTNNSDCNAMCMSLGSTCLGAFDNPNIAGEECDVLRPNMDTCDTDRGTEICACAR